MIGIFREENGKLSILRITLAFAVFIFLYMLGLWSYAFFLEVQKETPNYNGLALLLGAMVLELGAAWMAKVFQKAKERKKNERLNSN